MKKFNQIVKQAKALTKFKEARCAFVSESLIPYISDEVQTKIDFHLERIASMHANLGKDSSDVERKTIELLEQHEMLKIKAINHIYYRSISINDK